MSRKPLVLSLVGAFSLALAGTALAQTPFRVSASQKGSLLIYSKIEIRWSGDGQVLQDTFLDISNDHPDYVKVQGYFINGDTELQARCTGEPCDPDDPEADLVQTYEPGWNTANCSFTLTGDQPSWWSAASGGSDTRANQEGTIGGIGCTDFASALDGDDIDTPEFDAGRLNLETPDPTDRILRGYAIFWAVWFNPDPIDGSALGETEEIRWNHLKGDGLIVDYENGTAWEYNAWAFQARNVDHGDPTGTRHILNLDGNEYDYPFATLLLDFYASDSTALSGGDQTVTVDTDLTVHAVSADVRQDGCGPVLTKVEAEIWNEFETKFSGTRRCICCWDQTLLSDWVRSAAIPNHFRRSALRTDKGKARLDGISSIECESSSRVNDDFVSGYEKFCGKSAKQKRRDCDLGGGTAGGPLESENAAILGLSTKFLSFDPSGDQATAGMNLVGAGEEAAVIRYFLPPGPDELQDLSGRDVQSEGSKASGGKGVKADRESQIRQNTTRPTE
jgi:hypothetical protein